jgi:hypothetical protein
VDEIGGGEGGSDDGKGEAARMERKGAMTGTTRSRGWRFFLFFLRLRRRGGGIEGDSFLWQAGPMKQ